MIMMIEDLIAKGHAYSDGAGHVLFAVDSYKHYGDLSGRSTDDMIAGARVEVADYKNNPMDFVLWKPSVGDQPDGTARGALVVPGGTSNARPCPKTCLAITLTSTAAATI